MKTSPTSQHVWRFVRLFAVTFGAAVLASLNATGIHGATSSKTVLSLVLAGAVAAVETLYRAVSPAGQSRVLTLLAAVQTAYKSLQPVLPSRVAQAVAYAEAEVKAVEVPAAMVAPQAPVAVPMENGVPLPHGAPPGI